MMGDNKLLSEAEYVEKKVGGDPEQFAKMKADGLFQLVQFEVGDQARTKWNREIHKVIDVHPNGWDIAIDNDDNCCEDFPNCQGYHTSRAWYYAPWAEDWEKVRVIKEK
jgi:hypothetical protein